MFAFVIINHYKVYKLQIDKIKDLRYLVGGCNRLGKNYLQNNVNNYQASKPLSDCADDLSLNIVNILLKYTC